MFPYKIYTVDYDGETLEQISTKLGIPREQLVYLNDISEENQKQPLEPLTVSFIKFCAQSWLGKWSNEVIFVGSAEEIGRFWEITEATGDQRRAFVG